MRIIEVCINVEKSGLLASKALRAIASQRRSLDSRGQKSVALLLLCPLDLLWAALCPPQIHVLTPLPPAPQEATLFGEGGAEEVAREAGMSHTARGGP